MNRLNILYVCRLFNGFETSIESKEWKPTGVPTIYKMIDALNARSAYKVQVLITQKNYDKKLLIPLFRKIKFKGFDLNTLVLSAINLSSFPKLGRLIQELFHIFIAIFLLVRRKSDFLYVDNANIFLAAIVSRLRLRPVVFRVMGVYPAMREITYGNGIKNMVLRWCYASPFSLVICTQDGSGVEPWIRDSINRKTPVDILINGVSVKNNTTKMRESLYSKYSIPDTKFIVLFLGKLEKIKGIYDFIDGFERADDILNHNLHAVIVGHGQEYDNVKKKTSSNNSITLIPRVPHDEILQLHNIADIYVSTNKLANLTNANLESMSLGKCMIIPGSQLDTHVDIATDQLLSNNAVYRIPYPPSGQHVADALVLLYQNPELRSAFSANVLHESKKFISSWDCRIDKELKVIEEILC